MPSSSSEEESEGASLEQPRVRFRVEGPTRVGLSDPFGGYDAHGGRVRSRCLSLHSYQLPRVMYRSAALQKSPKMANVKVPPRLLHL